VVDLDFLAWASLSDQSGTYGLTKVVCEPVTFGEGTPRSVTFWRWIWRGLRALEELPI
jgi:hypothetical protein